MDESILVSAVAEVDAVTDDSWVDAVVDIVVAWALAGTDVRRVDPDVDTVVVMLALLLMASLIALWLLSRTGAGSMDVTVLAVVEMIDVGTWHRSHDFKQWVSM